MTSGNDFWAMGGYAGYVWPCFALGVAVLVWNLVSARRFYTGALKRAERALIAAASERR